MPDPLIPTPPLPLVEVPARDGGFWGWLAVATLGHIGVLLWVTPPPAPPPVTAIEVSLIVEPAAAPPLPAPAPSPMPMTVPQPAPQIPPASSRVTPVPARPVSAKPLPAKPAPAPAKPTAPKPTPKPAAKPAEPDVTAPVPAPEGDRAAEGHESTAPIGHTPSASDAAPQAGIAAASDQQNAAIPAVARAHYGALVRARVQAAQYYPTRARERGISGTATLRLTIADDGQLADVSLVTSSGSGLLDTAALKAVQDAAPFPPPPGGQASFTLPLVFQLND